MGNHPFCDKLGITENEICTRGNFVGFTSADSSNLQKIRAIVQNQAAEAIEQFYDHLAQFPEIARFLADPNTLHRLKESQRTYLLTLGEGWDTLDYCEDRLRIGHTHERISLQLKWYLGAYGKLFELLATQITRHYVQQPHEIPDLLVTLTKIFALDQQLAIEAYYGVTTERVDSLLTELAETQHRFKESSRWDGLTKVLNRKHLMESLEMEFHRSQRFKHSFTVIFLDIDYFKQINDRYGHAFGDHVLETIGEKLKKLVRPEDVVGRYGGEEFVVGLVECAADTAGIVAERLRASISMTNFSKDQQTIQITISLGFASLSPEISSLEELIKKADKALYQAKELGRNQVAFLA